MVKVRVLALGLSSLLLVALVSIMIGHFSGNEESPLSTRVTVQPGDVVQRVSNLLPQLTLHDLILHSDAIVMGTVADILPAKSGLLPDGNSIIYMDVIVEVDHYLYGEPESERIAIQVWGGRIGGIVMLVEDEPVFTIGEDILAFLVRLRWEVVSPDGIDPLSYYLVTGACLGKFAYRCGIAYRFPCKIVTICAIAKKVAEIKGS